jgi:hypothetical protein
MGVAVGLGALEELDVSWVEDVLETCAEENGEL